MFAKYKENMYRFIRNPRTNKHEIVTHFSEKSFAEFAFYKNGAYKEVLLDETELTDIFDVKLWIKHDTEVEGFSKEWNVALDGYGKPADGKIPILCNGTPDGWEVVEKYVGRKYVDPQEIEGAWITYTYKKKNGVLLEEPVVVHENVSVEKLLELREFYGGTL